MASDKQVEKGITDIVGALFDPIIVFPGGWGDDTPEWLRNAITLERLLMNMESLSGKEMTGTDAEAAAYLMSASLTRPMSKDWAQIYLYVAGNTMRRWGKFETPADITVKELNEEQMRDLVGLKKWLYMTRTTARKGKEVVSIAAPETLQAKFF